MAQKSKGKGSKKIGRNKAKCEAYRREDRRFRNKLRRVRKHNGQAAADQYSVVHFAAPEFRRVV